MTTNPKKTAKQPEHPLDDLIRTDHRFVPQAVFSNPQVAWVGATEQELKSAKCRSVFRME